MLRWGSFLGVLLLGFLVACSEREALAPVVESKWRLYPANKQTHKVLPGETLYAIAFRYDKDYRKLAQVNHLQPPYHLKIGQSILLKYSNKPPKKAAAQAQVKKLHSPPSKPAHSKLTQFNGTWTWPVNGKIVSGFAPKQGRKGVNISGKKGEKIKASAGGVVAYSGNGLQGYGNLIIIKHNNAYLTAYGNNAVNYVKEGQSVRPGQVIAKMGQIDRKYWGLHFEIRKYGKPINPVYYLKKA